MFCRCLRSQGISIHAPRVGSDKTGHERVGGKLHFNPRSPRGERQGKRHCRSQRRNISIHAPRVGSDKSQAIWHGKRWIFQSTLPAWGATDGLRQELEHKTISIHAPRVGSDFALVTSGAGDLYFNPRSPRGERLNVLAGLEPPPVFQSTLPAWGATIPFEVISMSCTFQSTLPVWGATNGC